MFVDIEGFDGRYKVNEIGEVWSAYKKGLMNPTMRAGYPYVILSKNGKQTGHSIHRLVAEAFIPNPDNLPVVNHKDENKLNNSVENLEWCSYLYNNEYSNIYEKAQKACSKTTYQYDLDLNLIATYPSTRAATKATGIANSQICNVCNGKRKAAHNYIFSYIPLDKETREEL